MSKNRFGTFWNFDPWRPQFWPERKNDRNDFEMIFRELSNAAFRFSLRRPGAEIMGGVQTPPPPPPSRRWEIQRPSRARVNNIDVKMILTVRFFSSRRFLYQFDRVRLTYEFPAYKGQCQADWWPKSDVFSPEPFRMSHGFKIWNG